MHRDSLLQSMNPKQSTAISADAGPVLVLAGPGSGKTAVLTRRIAWLIREQGIPHHRILAVTFTNKAAGEMRSRVEALLDDKLHGLQLGTFHSTCARFLRRDATSLGYANSWVIFDGDDQLALMKRLLRSMDMDATSGSAKEYVNAISRAKCEMTQAHDYHPRHYSQEAVRRVYIAYQNALRHANAMDFDDLLLNMVLVLRQDAQARHYYQHNYEAVLVDEFQDTNTVQYELVKLLAAPQNNVFVVGDEDQSIYAFRGADYRNIQRFRAQYAGCTQILMEQNYRSTSHILDLARAVIDRNSNRTAKTLYSNLGQGARVKLEEVYNDDLQAEHVLDCIRELCQSQGLRYKDIAIMYRSNWLSRAVEQMLMRNNIPYIMVGGVGFYKRREVKDMLAYLRLTYNPDDSASFGRIINSPKRGIGEKSVAAFIAWRRAEGMPQSQALESLRELAPAAMPTAARRKIQRFAHLWAGWREAAANGELSKLLNRIYSEVNYEAHLRKISDNEEDFEERKANVHEIWSMLGRAENLEQTLGEFLVEQSLYSDVDELEQNNERVTLITLHSAKGLEFPAVFIISVDEGVLPHHRSVSDEEERRLFYVGITRAERFLLINYTFYRRPSSFLYDLPRHVLDARPSILNMLAAAESMEAQTRCSPPAPVPPNTPANPALRKKIAPFPHSPPPDAAFRLNQRIRHPQFGPGRVIGIESAGTVVNVLFDQAGLKKVLADSDTLQALED